MTHRWIRVQKEMRDNEIVFCGRCGKNCGARKDHNYAHSHIQKDRYGSRMLICNECDSVERKVRLIKFQQEQIDQEYRDRMKGKVIQNELF